MKISARLRSKIIWLVLWTSLFATLAPSLSHFLKVTQGKTWVEVCSATGTKLVAIDSPGSKPEMPSNSGMHCLYCLQQQDLPVLPPIQAKLPIAIWHGGTLVLVAFNTPSISKPFWSAHQSRAPPAFS